MGATRAITILDGPMGTELAARGVATPPPLWSAQALRDAPHLVAQIHRDYAQAGADVLTTNTFRTQPRLLPDDWARLARLAVELAQQAACATGARVAGSIAPVEDCYQPQRSPGAAAAPLHRALAEVLAEAGVDLLLCETFPHPEEAASAVRAARSTGLPVWIALTAGPDGSLLTPQQLAEAARRCVEEGACAALVNCVAATKTLPYVEALAQAQLGVPVGAYANAGAPDDAMGWRPPPASPDAAQRYAALARMWVDAGASIVGSCCGTGVAHIAALAQRFYSLWTS